MKCSSSHESFYSLRDLPRSTVAYPVSQIQHLDEVSDQSRYSRLSYLSYKHEGQGLEILGSIDLDFGTYQSLFLSPQSDGQQEHVREEERIFGVDE